MNHQILFFGPEPYRVGKEISTKSVKDGDIIITADLLAKNKVNDNFKYINYNVALDRPPFLRKPKFEYDLEKITLFNLKYKILCYNRRTHIHRLILVYYLLNNENVKKNSLISIACKTYQNEFNFSKFFGLLKNKKEIQNIFNFYKNLNEDVKIDECNLFSNLGIIFSEDAYQKSFISLVTETNIEKDVLFTSEKTYKPIFAQQPFLILGNTGTLKYLKSIGFKTFDKWFDESYDDEIEFENRLKKILSVVEYICKLSLEDLTKIRIEMNEILIHNYKHFLTIDIAPSEIKLFGINQKKEKKYL